MKGRVMPFLQEAQSLVAHGNISKEMRVTLEYLIKNGVGRSSPVPLEELLTELDNHGFAMSGPRFQTSVLAQTREGDVFIGSGQRGYYLIDSEADAHAALEFYESRIQSELTRIKRLKALAVQNGWQL